MTPSIVLAKGKNEAPPAKELIPDNLRQQDVDGVVAGLSDEQARAALRERLRLDTQKEEPVPQEERTIPRQLGEANARLRERVLQLKAELPVFLDDLRRVSGAFLTNLPSLLLPLAGVAGIVIAASLAQSQLLSRLRRAPSFLAASQGEACGRGRHLMGSSVVALLGFLAFSLITLTLFAASIPTTTPSYNMLVILLSCVLFFKLLSTLVQVVFSPGDPVPRLVPVSDSGAASWRNFLLGFGTLFIVGRAIWELMITEGMQESGVMIFRLILAFLFYLSLCASLLAKREPVAAWLGERCSVDRLTVFGRYAQLWHIFALVYLTGVFLVWLGILLVRGLYGPHLVFLLSMLAIPAFLMLDRLLIMLLTGVFLLFHLEAAPKEQIPTWDEDELIEPTASREDTAAPAMGTALGGGGTSQEVKLALYDNSLFIFAVWLGRFCLLIFISLLLLHLWDLAPPLGTAFVSSFAKILAILLIAFGVWDLLNRSIQRRRSMAGTDEQKQQRILTLLPLLQKSAGIFIIVTAVLMVISQAGVNIGPLLASAGVFGLALGLGMQTLVKDVISGVFFLLDDSIRVGDYIATGSTEGNVMKMSLRTITLRHPRGYMMILPYGDMKNIVNYSRGPIIEKLKIPMPLDTDPRKFRKIVKRVNEDLMGDEEFKDFLVRPVKSQGIRKVSNSVLEFGVKFTAKPGTQFLIKREVYSRLYAAFQEKGLSFAVPGVVIYGSDKGGGAEAAAAQAVLAQRKDTQKESEKKSE